MCGRFTLHTEKDLLARRFAVDLSGTQLSSCYNIVPTQPVLVVRPRVAALEATRMRWGLVPIWAASPRELPQMINARSETLAQKPAYREALARRRCLILADGFYEWRAAGDRKALKTPFHIARRDGGPFAFAGLWERWRSAADQDWLLSCTIVTRDASPALRSLHARMPVILPETAEAAWLDPSCDGQTEHLLRLLAPLADREIRSYPVSTRVNDPAQDGPELIAPVLDPQPTLF